MIQIRDMKLNQAKEILCQLGWFDDGKLFLSLNLTKAEFKHVEEALSHRENLSIEAYISALCEQDILDREEKENHVP